LSRADFTQQKPDEKIAEGTQPGGTLPPEDPAPEAAEATTGADSEQLERLRAEKDDLQRALVRLQADFDNYRKRVDRERAADHARALGHAVEGLLPALDGFERALAAHNDPAYEEYRKGFDLIYRQLMATLSRLGLERIEAVGMVFDPHMHQAVERVDSSEYEDGTVIAEMQAGYLFRGRVLRPAMVRVAVHSAPAPRSN
jgi:molecular chaperone GrpE